MESTFNWDEVEVGKEVAPLEYVLSEELVQGFAEAVEDSNDWYFKDSPFGGRVAPASISATDYVALLAQEWGMFAGLHAKHRMELINPARVGSRLRVSARIKDKYEKRGRKYVELEYTAVDEDGRDIVRHTWVNVMGGG